MKTDCFEIGQCKERTRAREIRGEGDIRTKKRQKTNEMLQDKNNVINEEIKIEQRMLLLESYLLSEYFT